MSRILLLLFILTSTAHANWRSSLAKGVSRNSEAIIVDLMRDGFYFSAVPVIKEYLINNRTVSARMNALIDQVVSKVGVKPLELLDPNILGRSNADSVKYIIGKRFLKDERYSKSIALLKAVSTSSEFYPYALNLLGTAYSFSKENNLAIETFKDCIANSKSSKARTGLDKKQLEINRDYCITGIARAYYAAGAYKEAELAYLDLDKSSAVWPSILLEEAWTSFYLKNYNRSLGKLVTYKAPVFENQVLPETDVLTALTYLEMCLYDDARKAAESYYSSMMKPVRSLRSFLLSKRKNYNYFYSLMASVEDGKRPGSGLLTRSLKSISKEPAYQEIKVRLFDVSDEYKRARGLGSRGSARILRGLAAESLRTQKTILGSYVRSRLLRKYAELYQAFVDMSYIKLEILSRKKERLYKSLGGQDSGKRGDVKYLDRNDKQYFWDFNGEFWADELGDYVFALKSEC